MKILIAAAALFAAHFASGDTLAILGKNQVVVLHDSGAISGVNENPSHLRFIKALGQMKKGEYETQLPLVSPPEWGKTVPGSEGLIHYQKSFAQGFRLHLLLEGLASDHTYILTLNGNPEFPGNERLLDPVPGNPQERFYDFLRIATDSNGKYDADLGIYLLPGLYHVRLYVKDTTDFKIVLYRDFFDFSVKPEETGPGSSGKK